MPTATAHSLISISKAAKILGLSADTLRNWEASGKLIPTRTIGGSRRYSMSQLLEYKKEMGISPKSVISISQAAKSLNVSSDTLRNWDKRGLLEVERTKGGARRFSRVELNRLKSELGIVNKPILEPNIVSSVNPGTKLKKRILWELFGFTIIVMFLLGLNLYLLPSSLQESLLAQKQDIEKQIYQITSNLEALQNNVYQLQTDQSKNEVAVLGASYDNSQVDALARKVAILSERVEKPEPSSSATPQAPAAVTVITETKVLSQTFSGQGQIQEGSNSAQISTADINDKSRILVTPTSNTDLILAVTKKEAGSGFTVSASKLASPSAQFDWWMVNEVQ